jgi:hypothetical protein
MSGLAESSEETPVPAEITFAQLVDEFVETMRAHGLAIDRGSVEQEMRDRIADIAERLRIDPQTVLDVHARKGWGRQMSASVIEQVRRERLVDKVELR